MGIMSCAYDITADRNPHCLVCAQPFSACLRANGRIVDLFLFASSGHARGSTRAGDFCPARFNAFPVTPKQERKKMLALSLDMGGTHIACGVVRDNELLGSTSLDSELGESLESLLPYISATNTPSLSTPALPHFIWPWKPSALKQVKW